MTRVHKDRPAAQGAAGGSSPPKRPQTIETRTLALCGLDVHLIQLAATASPGSGTLRLIGPSEASARESRVRVRAALQQLGVNLGAHDISVSIAPADLATGGIMDAALAVAVLGALGELAPEAIRDMVILGELSLTGSMRPTRGVLPALRGAAALGVKRAIVPHDNAREAALARGIKVLVADHLEPLVRHLKTRAPLSGPGDRPEFRPIPGPGDIDLADVRGQASARRALEITAAGGHHLLMVGPPGSGKTMLARRLATILPPLSLDEALEITALHSVAGLLPIELGILSSRPFRAPHHTVSAAGLVGGGDPVRPGEVSLAHQGVLFLDELEEFKRCALDTLRFALDDGHATLSRARRRAIFPARTLLVSAMLPCPCGRAGERLRRCNCSPERIALYRERMRTPFVDRFDMQIALPPVDVSALQSSARGESSRDVQKRVVAARAAQARRGGLNAHLSPGEIERFATPDAGGRKLLGAAAERLNLSAAVYARVLRVARTIADLDESDTVRAPHVAEAVHAAVSPFDRAEQG